MTIFNYNPCSLRRGQIRSTQLLKASDTMTLWRKLKSQTRSSNQGSVDELKSRREVENYDYAAETANLLSDNGMILEDNIFLLRTTRKDYTTNALLCVLCFRTYHAILQYSSQIRANSCISEGRETPIQLAYDSETP